MIEILKRYNDKTFDVCEKEVSIGDEFVVGYNPVEKKKSNKLLLRFMNNEKKKAFIMMNQKEGYGLKYHKYERLFKIKAAAHF